MCGTVNASCGTSTLPTTHRTLSYTNPPAIIPQHRIINRPYPRNRRHLRPFSALQTDPRRPGRVHPSQPSLLTCPHLPYPPPTPLQDADRRNGCAPTSSSRSAPPAVRSPFGGGREEQKRKPSQVSGKGGQGKRLGWVWTVPVWGRNDES